MNRRAMLGALGGLLVAATAGCRTGATVRDDGGVLNEAGTPAGRVHILDFYDPT